MSRQQVARLSLMAIFVSGLCATAVASAEGPFWHRDGAKLTQGPRVAVSGQSKGNLTLSWLLGGAPITITCTASNISGTIEGQGATLQGQGKGTVKYSGCTTNVGCGIGASPTEKPASGLIETNQLKLHLATAQVQEREQIVALLEPSPSSQTMEKVFVTFALANCQLRGIVKITGSMAAQIEPQEAESQDGWLNFPTTPITTVTHEGQTVNPKLFLGVNEATFAGFYNQKVQSGTFGVFRT